LRAAARVESEMQNWKPVVVTQSGRPEVFPNEVEQYLTDSVNIYEGEHKSKFERGVARITTHRIIWQSSVGCVAVNLSDIASLQLVAGGIRASAKLNLVFGNQTTSTLAFKEGGRDEFVDKLKLSMSKRIWLEKPASTPKTEFSTKGAGITGIMARVEADTKRTDSTLNAAFADIDELMVKAKDVVRLAQKFAAAQARAAQDTDNKDDVAYRAALVQLGIASPVTRESAGSQYHNELSRQLADWLTKRALKLHNGVILLTDLYCMFNRARGTEMISPEDLYRACMLFDQLSLNVRLKQFKSGVLVVLPASESDTAVAQRMEAEIKQRGPMSAYALSQVLKMPLILAREQLEEAERQQLLCRDETLNSIVFYPNFFKFLEVKVNS